MRFNKRTDKTAYWLFLMGLFMFTEVRLIGSVGISELACYVVAPFFFFQDYAKLKNDGFTTVLWLLVFAMLGCVVSSFVNHVYPVFAIKAFAFPFTMFADIVVLHRLLRHRYRLIIWLFFGLCISNVINIFVFQRGTESVLGGELMTGAAAVEAVMGGTLFWAQRIAPIFSLPIRGWYFQTPVLYSVVEPLIAASLTMAQTSSGRSRVIIVLVGVVFVALAGKNRAKMRKLGRHLIVIMLVLLALGGVFKSIYAHLASTGALGEGHYRKYEHQSRSGNSMLRILMSGRSEFFVSLMACMDRPLVGWGARALDTNHYYETFLIKYGGEEDVDEYMGRRKALAKYGIFDAAIPNHTGVGYFWLAFGLPGLIFWIYVFGMLYVVFRRYLSAIPQWYGYICYAVPTLIWAGLFSPPERWTVGCVMTCVLFLRAVGRHRLPLPPDMEFEARQFERK